MPNFKKDLQFTYRPFLSILGTGLVTSDGKLWRKQRTLVSAAFRIDILDQIPEMAKQAVERLASELEELRGTGKSIEIGERLRHLTLQVIAEAVLSLPSAVSDETFAKMYLPIVTEGNIRTWHPYREFIPNKTYFDYKKHVKNLNQFITKIITDRWSVRMNEKTQTSARKQDILDRILGSVNEGEWNSETILQLRDEVKTFILAGHETSASMLTWTILELARHPEFSNRLKQEAIMVFGEECGPKTPVPGKEKLDQLEYSLACLKESLRLYSVVPVVTRVADQSSSVGDYYIPGGTTLILGLQSVHHNSNLWPNPLEYQPERFYRQEIKPYSFLSFIDGPRNCLGQHLALLESKVVLAILFQRFKFTVLPESAKGEKHPWMVPIIPKNGLMITVE